MNDSPTTVGEAVRLLNEKHLHPTHHLFFISMDLLQEKMMELETIKNVMDQTFDWRFGGKAGQGRVHLNPVSG